MDNDLKTGRRFAIWLRKAAICCAALGILNSPLGSSFINTFRVKTVMAEPITIKEKPAEKAVNDFYYILKQIPGAKGEARDALLSQASGIIKDFAGNKKFTEGFPYEYKKLLKFASAGDAKSYETLLALEDLLAEGSKKMLDEYKKAVKNFYNDQVKSPEGTYYATYQEYTYSPFYSEGTFSEFVNATLLLKGAESLVNTVKAGNTGKAKEIFTANKENDEFITAVAWKMFRITENTIAFGDKSKITTLTNLLGLEEAGGPLSEKFAELLSSYVKVEGGKYYDLYANYKSYAAKQGREAEFFDFLETICAIHEAIDAGKTKEFPDQALVLSVADLSKVKPVLLGIKEGKGLAVIEKENAKSAIAVAEIRVKQMKGSLGTMQDFVNDYVKDEVTAGLRDEVNTVLEDEIKDEGKQKQLMKTVDGWVEKVEKWSKKPPTPEEIEKTAEEMRKFINANIKDAETKEALLNLVDGWTERMNSWKRITSKLAVWGEKVDAWKADVEKADGLMKSKKKMFTDEELEFLRSIPKYPDEIDKFLENEFVTSIEAKGIKQLSMAFIHALMTGSDQSYSEFTKLYSAVEGMEDKAPKKYLFYLDLIGAFLQTMAPGVYDIVKTPDMLPVAEQAVTSRDDLKTIGSLKKLYGAAFVDFILMNPVFDEIASTASEEKKTKLISENKAIIDEAKLLFRLPDYFRDAVEETYLAVSAKDTKKIEELKGKYGDKFVDQIGKKESMEALDKIFSSVEATVFTIAEEQPELFAKLVDSYVPMAQEALLSDIDEILRDAMNFRESMNLALKETDAEVALADIGTAFANYEGAFGNNLAVLRFMYDLDGMAGKKVTTLSEAQHIFENMATTVLSDKGKETLAMAEGSASLNLIGKYYLIKGYKEIVFANNFTAAELKPITATILAVSERDQWLLPSFFEKVMKPIASVTKGDGTAFSEALYTFNGMFMERYPVVLTDLGYMTNTIRDDFTAVFNKFEKNLPALSKEMTHFELQDEVRERGEMAEKEVYPPYNLYAQKKTLWEGMSYGLLDTGLLLKPPLDILPNPMMPGSAYNPTGEIGINSDAENLYVKMDAALGAIGPLELKPPIPKDFQIGALARSRLAKSIREAFGVIPLSYSEDLITAFGEAGMYGKGGKAVSEEGVVTEEYAGGGATEATERFAEGGLVENILTETGATTVTKKVGEEEETETAATGYLKETLGGAHVGPVAAITQTFDMSATKGKTPETYRGTLDALVGLSKKQGHSLLTYIPEAVYVTEGGEKAIAGKFYYITPDGDAYQLGVGHDADTILKSFLFGSAETDNILASFRKYDIGSWDEKGEWKNWGGAAGFTVNTFAAFAMEDMLRRVGYTTDSVTGEKKVNLEGVALSAVPFSFAVNKAFEDGTIAFITRMAVPATAEALEEEKKLKWDKGIYTGELILKHIEPHTKEAWHDWELRLMGGYPAQAGILFKSHKEKDGKIKSWFAKASTASYLLWSSLLQQEEEATNVADYVRNAMVELYHWSEDEAKAEGYFIGGSLMFAGIDETQGSLEKFKDLVSWDNTFFTIVASYYASKFSLFSGVQKLPGYMQSATQLMDQRLSEMLQNPERIGDIGDQLAKQIEGMSKTTIWKGVAGITWNPQDWVVQLVGKTEVMEPEGYGYNVIGGGMHIGYLKNIKPYFEAQAYSYGLGTTYNTEYIDIYASLGAKEISALAPHEILSIETEKPPATGAELKKFMGKNKEDVLVTLFTRYYKLSDELVEKIKPKEFEFVYAPHLASEDDKVSSVYYLLIDTKTKKGYLGDEKDRANWAEKGFSLYQDIFVLRSDPDEEKLTVETVSTSESVWLSRLKAIGGITLKIKPEVAQAGWTAGLLADVFKDYKKNILLGTFYAKKEFDAEDGLTKEDWSQFVLTVSWKWKKLDWKTMHDTVFGYVFFNYLTKEAYVAPPDEAEALFKSEKYTAGTGWSWGFFDGTLGEKNKLEIFVEAGAQKFTTKGKATEVLGGEYVPPAPLPGGEMFPGGFANFAGFKEKWVKAGEPKTDFIMRAAISYAHKISYHGFDGWLTFQAMGYKGWWPLGQPVNITQPWLLQSQSTMWDLERAGVMPWGFMLYGGWKY